VRLDGKAEEGIQRAKREVYKKMVLVIPDLDKK